MSKPPYTVIPDTSDTDYWEIKSQNGQERSATFVPRDKELHQLLKQNARKTSQVKQAYKDRHKHKD